LIIRKFEDTDEQDVDALLGSLKSGIKNKWIIGKGVPNGLGKLSFALKYNVIEPGKLYPMHYCERTEATFVLEGKGVIRNEKEEFEITAGDVVLIRCGEMNSLRNAGKTDLKTLSCIDLITQTSNGKEIINNNKEVKDEH
jgi:mannose-6-phosphate isomerase-like protein (cupin superfamily)